MKHIQKLEDGESGAGSVNVVRRLGNTVIRPTGPWSSAVHELLRHLLHAGFDYSPRVVGIDEHLGTEQLTYLEGEVAMRPWPRIVRSESGIEQIGLMLRKYHESVSTFRPSSKAIWRIPDLLWETGMIIRHGDLGPWNMVWSEERLVGLIDWDFAEPGLPIDDVAQVAWYCIPLRSIQCVECGVETCELPKRLSILCCAYGVRAEYVVEALTGLQKREIHRLQYLAQRGVEPWVTFKARGDLEKMLQESEWLHEFKRHLGCS